jgi:DNA modification methylase
MEIKFWPIERVTPYPKNARKITDKAVEKVAASIQEFGWRQPIVVDVNGVIVIGHIRRLAAIKLEMTEVPVHVADNLTPAQIRALRLADNRIHEEAAWDMNLLGSELMELNGLGEFNIGLTGFDERELNKLLKPNVGLTDEDAAPALPIQPTSRLGDCWMLGQHRLVAGDATDADSLHRLMAGEQADLVFTDPPYNVDYEGYTEAHLTIDGDKMSASDFKRFLEAAFQNCRAAVKSGASLYICHSSSWQREFQAALETAGFEVRCQIIWAKNTFAWGFGRYKFRHEPIFYAHVAGQSDPWYGDKSQSTLWEEKKPVANRLHPTMKPVELVERALLNSSKAGDSVLDLFGGSGSTLIACEKFNRTARAMEIDPRYVDVIVERWQQFTGKKATLEGLGATFEHVKEGRLLEREDALKEELVETMETKS